MQYTEMASDQQIALRRNAVAQAAEEHGVHAGVIGKWPNQFRVNARDITLTYLSLRLYRDA